MPQYECSQTISASSPSLHGPTQLRNKQKTNILASFNNNYCSESIKRILHTRLCLNQKVFISFCRSNLIIYEQRFHNISWRCWDNLVRVGVRCGWLECQVQYGTKDERSTFYSHGEKPHIKRVTWGRLVLAWWELLSELVALDTTLTLHHSQPNACFRKMAGRTFFFYFFCFFR